MPPRTRRFIVTVTEVDAVEPPATQRQAPPEFQQREGETWEDFGVRVQRERRKRAQKAREQEAPPCQHG
jgi:broad specificity phosphatase PhoE